MKASRGIAGVVVLAAFALLLAPPVGGMAPKTQMAAALCLAGIALWATAALPELITSLLFLLGAILLKLAEPDVILSGFTSTAWWLVFGGLIVGVAVKDTGLGGRLARTLAARFGGSYPGLIGGMVGIGVVLGFLMPSSLSRVVLLLPITMALAERSGFRPGSNGWNGMMLATLWGAFVIPFTVLPANIPNMILIGAAEKLYGVEMVYGRYLLAHFPVLGALKAVVVTWAILKLLPDKPRLVEASADAPKPMSRDERILTFILIASLALWVTDFLHHVSAAWVSLGAATLCLMPGIGLVALKTLNEKLPVSSLIYLGAVLGLGALIDATGVGRVLADALLAVAPLAPGQPATNFAVIVGFSCLVGLATMLPGLVAVTAPLCGSMAQAAGLPVEIVLQMQAVAYSTLLLPYQGPPMVIGMQLAHVGMRPATKLCLVMTAATVAVLMPLDYFWWRLIGLL